MVERKDFLYRNLALSGLVEGSSYGSICALANRMQKLVIITLITLISNLEKMSRSWDTPISNFGRGFGFLREDMETVGKCFKCRVGGVVYCR
jgi:hypothetical protein